MRNAAIIELNMKLLLDMLDFKGGIIHRVYTPDDLINPSYFNVVIEHPDLPEVEDGERLPVVTPTMQSFYGEDGSLLKIERIDPPKRGKK